MGRPIATLQSRLNAVRTDRATVHACARNAGLGGLLDISRLDAGGMQSEVRMFAAGPLLQNLATEFRLLAEAKGLDLRHIPTRAWLRSDPQLLRRVLQNFLSNAVKYTRNGRILFGVRRTENAIRIEVWDSGLGIAESDRTAIFEEFRRLDRGGSGLGLGLSIAERIARLLDHRLSLRSRLGHGSVFAIDVPLAIANDQEETLPNEVIEVPPQRVLVVDNDRSVLAATAALLASWDFVVFTASESESAQVLAQRERPQLLVFDYHLDDGLTGLDLRKMLTMRDSAVPCLIVTADHDEMVRAAVLAAGCYLLHKPLKPLAFRSLIARVLTASDAPH